MACIEHPDLDRCLLCGAERRCHVVDPQPGQHEFLPGYLIEWLAA